MNDSKPNETAATSHAEAIFAAALSLPVESRSALVGRLLESFRDGVQADIDESWLKEAERRLQAYEQGNLEAIPAEKVLRSPRTGESKRQFVQAAR